MAGASASDDVARIEFGTTGTDSQALLDGKPVVGLCVHPGWKIVPRDLRAQIRDTVALLRKRLPEGLDLQIPFDFTPNLEAPDSSDTPEYLLLDPELPAAASAERIFKVLQQCSAILRQLPGVGKVLVMTENPFDRTPRACILVELTPADKRQKSRQQIIEEIRTQLARQIPEAAIRLRDLAGLSRFPRCGYPIDLAIHGPEAEQVREFAHRLADRLARCKELTDATADPASRQLPQLTVDVDRKKVQELGVPIQNVFDILQFHLGGLFVNDFNRFGRTWQVVVQADSRFRKEREVLMNLKVPGPGGKQIPLSALATVREVGGPTVIDRLDGEPMVEITANPAPGVSLAAARKKCEDLAAEVRQELKLPAAYRLTWLHEFSGRE